MRYAVVENLPVCGGSPNGPPEGVLYATNLCAVKLNGRLLRGRLRILSYPPFRCRERLCLPTATPLRTVAARRGC